MFSVTLSLADGSTKVFDNVVDYTIDDLPEENTSYEDEEEEEEIPQEEESE